MSAGLVSSEVSLFDLKVATFSLSSHGLPSVHACVLISSYKNTSHIGLSLILIVSFLTQLPLSRHYLQIQLYSEVLEVRTSTYEFLEDTVQLITEHIFQLLFKYVHSSLIKVLLSRKVISI